MREQVFISHASEDRAIAQEVCDALEASGLSCWIAFRDIAPGAAYSRAIMDAIAASHSLVVIVSSRTRESQHVLREVERAADRGLLLVPVRVEDASPGADLEYFLSSVQWIDAFPSITGSVIARIAASLQAAAGVRPRPGPPSPIPLIDARDIRARMLAARSRHELQRLASELDAQLRRAPHDVDALMLKDDLARAIRHEEPPAAMAAPSAASPGARRSRVWVAAAASVIAVVAIPFLLSQANRTPPPDATIGPATAASPAPVDPAAQASEEVFAMLPAIEARTEPRRFLEVYEELRRAIEVHAAERQSQPVRSVAFEQDSVSYGMHFLGGTPRFVLLTVLTRDSMSIYLPRLNYGQTREPMDLANALRASPPGLTNMIPVSNESVRKDYERALAAWAARKDQFTR